MITLSNKKDCCGCAACVQICPKKCIALESDYEGFLYPSVNTEICINCGICESTCPIINEKETSTPKEVYAAFNPDVDTREHSSSGGIFTAMAEHVIANGGIVFGARFNDKWEVVHDFTETKEGIQAFRGSKYVQSIIGDCYKKTKDFLNIGRSVLFSGTPCQIGGLKQYLRKDYNNLYLVSVVCHGVPSPRVWNDYKEYIKHSKDFCKGRISFFRNKNKSEIKSLSFRDKRNGWKKYGLAAEIINQKDTAQEMTRQNRRSFYEPLQNSLFLQGFIRDLYLRPSCYDCRFRCGKSHSDITLADYWRIEDFYPEFDDDKGLSLILVNTRKGSELISKLSLNLLPTTYDQGYYGNHSLELNPEVPINREIFWADYERNGIRTIKKHLPHISVFMRFKMLVKKTLFILH